MRVKMNFSNISPISGKSNTRTLEVDPGDIMRWHNGALIQDALPYLTPGEREFLLSGITDEEWEELFKQKGKTK
jgi:hypothetical protein